jgi:hypothetical protein
MYLHGFPGGMLAFHNPTCFKFNQATLQPTPLPQAEVIFLVQIPENTPQNKTVNFEIVDEITGIPLILNAMQPTELTMRMSW